MTTPPLETVRRWRRRNPQLMSLYDRRNRLKSQYGMSVDDYAIQLEEQGGMCAICYTDDPSPRDRFTVDHDHQTGEVRGLLCPRCNLGLGQFRDDPNALMNAVTYLDWRPWVVPRSFAPVDQLRLVEDEAC